MQSDQALANWKLLVDVFFKPSRRRFHDACAFSGCAGSWTTSNCSSTTFCRAKHSCARGQSNESDYEHSVELRLQHLCASTQTNGGTVENRTGVERARGGNPDAVAEARVAQRSYRRSAAALWGGSVLAFAGVLFSVGSEMHVVGTTVGFVGITGMVVGSIQHPKSIDMLSKSIWLYNRALSR